MKINLLLMVLLVLYFSCGNDRAQAVDISKIVQGTLKKVSANLIQIKEDPAVKEDRIAIDSNTVYDNVQKWADLKAGDTVQIDYKMNHDMATAITITKIEPGNEGQRINL